MGNFADSFVARCTLTKGVLTAGIDPVLDAMPAFIREQCERAASSDEDFVYDLLTRSYIPCLEALSKVVPACKPNIAFFEQYGIAGLRAFSDIVVAARKSGLLVIADAKRGDIGNTALAYAAAFLGGSKVRGKKLGAFESDALTVSPYLGADTLTSYLDLCRENAKGLFVLVRTSNPGSDWLQDVSQDGATVADRVAQWIAEQGASLIGASGFSSLGAVVGATYPEQAKALRKIMKSNLFLIPGFGAQGGKASDAVSGFSNASIKGAASTVNVSRGLFSVFSQTLSSEAQLCEAVVAKAEELNRELNAELS